MIASHVPDRAESSRYFHVARQVYGHSRGAVSGRQSARATIEFRRWSYEIACGALHGSAYRSACSRCAHAATFQLDTRSTRNEMRVGDYELQRRARTAHHVRAQRRAPDQAAVNLWNDSPLSSPRGHERGAWHMRCAYQGVVAVVPWRVAAFETGARVSMTTRLKERDVMNLKNLAYYLRAKLGRNESGQDLLEYALLVALIALVSVGVITSTGSGVQVDLHRHQRRAERPIPK